MARFCYGQITHEGSINNPIKFPSIKDREVFQAEFEAYHAQYKHDGEVPTFETIKRAEIRKEDWDIPTRDEVTIDGYKPHEIWEYHDRDDGRWVHYRPPTTCVHPIIAISNTELFESGELQRHELSGIFGDMPDEDYQSLLESIRKDGFIDPVIRLLESEVLDGWHRYRAGKELNLLRRLQFRQWYEAEHRDGDPRTFVLARNIERRHLNPGQRAQILVAFNERFGQGIDPRSLKSPNGDFNGKPKTRQELAAEAGVGTSTIDRAIQVEKAGGSRSVISGEKTAGDVLREQALEHLEVAEKKMWQAFEAAKLGDLITRDAFLRGACIAHKEDWDVDEVPDPEDMSTPQFWEARFEKLARDIEAEVDWIQELIGEDSNSEVDLQTEYFKARADLEALVKSKGCGLLAFHTAAKVKYQRKDSEIFNLPGEIRRSNNPQEVFKAWTGDLLTMKKDVEADADWFAVLIEVSPSATVDEPEESEPDYERLQQEHVKRFEVLPGEIRAYLPTWKRTHAIPAGNVTLRLLVDARSQVDTGRERGPDPFYREEMEDVLQRMKSNDADFVAKVRELLSTPDTSSEPESDSQEMPDTAPDAVKHSAEFVDVPPKTIQDVIPGVKVLSIKLVLSGHDDVWFEDDSRAPNAIPLSSVPEEVLAQLLMLTQDTNRLDAAAEEFVKAFKSKIDELRLSDYMILGVLKEACTHYLVILENLLILTDLFPDQFDAEDAKTYRERMVAPDINAWINTLKSMKRDVETCENWMHGLS